MTNWLVDWLKITAEIETGRQSCIGEEVTGSEKSKNRGSEEGRKGGVVEDMERAGGMFLEHNEDQYHAKPAIYCSKGARITNWQNRYNETTHELQMWSSLLSWWLM